MRPVTVPIAPRCAGELQVRKGRRRRRGTFGRLLHFGRFRGAAYAAENFLHRLVPPRGKV
jgi:hypothetical protein